MSKKRIILGIDNFKKLIDNNGYYVDKTLLIKELIDKSDQIVLITRPRRFGKTLNMSMLKYFFEIPQCRQYDFEEIDVSYLFSNFEIFKAGEEYKNEFANYPVVYLTFKNAKQSSWSDTYENLKETIANEYKRHRYILDSDVLSDSEKKVFNKIMDLEGSKVQYTNVIINLTEYLKRYFKKDCYVIIDEYDTPIQAGYIEGYFKEVTDFMKSVLVKGFKDNISLKQGILTGIMKVAQESIFSDFNNPSVNTILSNNYKDKFGFTETEVEELANNFELFNHLNNIKTWYNGYIFGTDTIIYNPWSIIKYANTPQDGLRPYWSNTSDNRIIKEVMQLDKVEGRKTVNKLIKGEAAEKELEENVVYQNIKTNPDVAWSFLTHAGYLKAYDRQQKRLKFSYKLEIPNLEIQTIYEDMIINYLKDDEKILGNIEAIINTLFDNNIDKFERLLRELYLKQVSYNDVKSNKFKYEDMGELEQDQKFESFHHGFMLGLFVGTSDNYIVESNKEYGLGRPDIVIIPKDTEKTAYVFEFKWDSTKGSKSLESLTKEALNQIKDKKYSEGIQKIYGHKNVKCIGIGFKGKELKILSTS
ncbi:UNVERIFIED_CONTAM: PD-(D/E)XK nuclease superfamily protein [Acetivibrio alkalicellulosi]